MSAPLVYNPKNVTITLDGKTVTGFAEGSKITISKADAITSTTRGIDGTDVSINIMNMIDGTATFTLLHNAEFNKVMREWEYSYSLGDVNKVTALFEMEDPSGGNVSTLCWLETQPDYDVAQETGEQAWTLHLQDARVMPSQGSARLSALGAFTGFKLI